MIIWALLVAILVLIALLTPFAVRYVYRALSDRCSRLERLSSQVAALARGETPAFVVESDKAKGISELANLERSVAVLTTSTSLRIEETRRETARQRIDAQVQRALGMAETEGEVLDLAARAFGEAAPSCPTELLLANESESELHLAAVGPKGPPGCPVATPSGCAAMRSGHTLRFPDVHALDLCPHLRNRPGGPKRAACIPLAPTRGTTGVLHVTSSSDDDQPIEDYKVAQLEVVAGHVGSRLRMLHVLSVFQTQAETDVLTGLLNRRSFEQRIAGLLRAGAMSRSVIVAIADIDHFKKLNDTHGHAAGDHGLRLFARTARAFASERSGFAARIGGEEFALVLPVTRDQAGAADVKAKLDELRDALRMDMATAGGPTFTVSIGAAIFPAHGSNLSELLSVADRALYQAKGSGRDRVVVHGGASPEANAPTPDNNSNSSNNKLRSVA